ncbi:hypothetical protein CANINC_001876 [Pichia inconspicua]|uniref:SH3 domain-containing protein n=1 Tax=Pichia inconspicua TaxID=52247 RepID=A0A4T0X3Z2_9ASCO|nr:hypothetical protein CANINC_001876 [[Candida] inconspicua]
MYLFTNNVLLKAPQLIKSKLNINNETGSDSFTGMNGVSKAQLEHTKELISGFNILILEVKKHEVSLINYVNHCYNVFSLIEQILDQREKTLSPVVDTLRKNISTKSKHFENRSNSLFDQLSKLLKGVQKTIKEREYIALDFAKYNSQIQKYSQGNENTKKLFENKQKLLDTKSKIEKIDTVITNELPSLLILLNKIAELLAILICCHVHDIYETMYESFWCTKKMFPSVELDNVSFQKMKDDIKVQQASIIEKIESFKLFEYKSKINIYNDTTNISATVASPTKFGTALYPFKGEKEKNISFNKGDIVKVIEETQDGWWKGVHVVTGIEGLFPYNYFKF